jgi:hypothetical protein
VNTPPRSLEDVTGPLARPSARLRENPPPGFPGRPGRPRTLPRAVPPVPRPEVTQTPARRGRPPLTRVPDRTLASLGLPPAPVMPLVPRLLGVEAAAHYCGVSPWTVREWLRAGVIRRVPVPARVLRIDRVDLDAGIEAWKASALTDHTPEKERCTTPPENAERSP